MNRREAQSLLIAYRPRRGERDPQLEEALAESRRDPELREWLRGQQRFHDAAEQSLRSIPVPAGLKDKLLRERKIVPLPWWREPTFWAAAAAVMLLAAVLAPQLTPTSSADFAIYRSRVVRTVLRQYTMDVVTTNIAEIETFLQEKKAPARDLRPGQLASLQPIGAGILSWQGRRVSMVCLNGGGRGTLFLFVADASAVDKAPKSGQSIEQISTLATVSWQQNGKVYVLAGEMDAGALRHYL